MFLATIFFIFSIIIFICVVISSPERKQKDDWYDWYERQRRWELFVSFCQALCILSLWYFLFNISKIFF